MTPGSDEAIEAGCECPVLDNARGQGSGYTGDDGQPLFWISEACPLHGKKEEETPRDAKN
jgi:hypothetical protein